MMGSARADRPSRRPDAANRARDQWHSISYCVTIAPHYSGMMCGHFPDFPGLVVLGRDHVEVLALAAESLDAELEHHWRQDGAIPLPRAEGPLSVSAKRLG